MQAAGQYGEAPQYLASRVGTSHGGHMFSLSHEMSLSSAATAPPAQTHAHGHGLSLSHSPAHPPSSQSHGHSQTVSSAQPLFLQSQHPQQQQQARNGCSAAPSPAPAAPSIPRAPQPAQPLQSAVQQLQADIQQHQQHQLSVRSHEADELGAQEAASAQQQSAKTGESIPQIKPKEPSVEARGDAAIAAPSAQEQMSVAAMDRAAKEETSGDGEEMDEEGERGNGGNRWPREEAVALLKIRSEMDAAFRDSSLKGPLWEQISRKLAELGYNRSAKKCKEKFENVHKYYKRTKEGKTGRQDGKSYRFFAQLEALYSKASSGSDQQQRHPQQCYQHHHLGSCSTVINLNTAKSPIPHGATSFNAVGSNNNIHPQSVAGLFSNLPADNAASAVGFNITAPCHSIKSKTTAGSNALISAPLPLASFPSHNSASAAAAAAAAAAATNAHIARTLERAESMERRPEDNPSLQYCFESSEESDADSDDQDEENDHDDDGDDNDDNDDDGGGDDDDDDGKLREPVARRSSGLAPRDPPRGRKRKRAPLRKYLVLFEKITKKVLDKQEHMQQKFLEALERRDQDRMIREEAWKRQEMARLNREHDVRAAERALSASRDASLVAFLQKLTGQTVAFPHQGSSVPLQMNNHYSTSTAIVPADYLQNDSNADRDLYDLSGSKRWPKPEVLALIKLRTSLDQRFHEPGSKTVLWEEISAAMASQGYARTAKRCKEKWENINKYFKKAKESNKKRPENAKTCPYFHHLNALYKEGLLGGGGGACSVISKHLIASEKLEEQPEEVMETGVNTSSKEGNGQGHDGASAALPSRSDTHASAGLPSSTEPRTAIAGTLMASPPAPISTSSSLTLMTGSGASDARMHMFLHSERGDNRGVAGIPEASGDIAHPMIDLSAAAPCAQAAGDSLPHNLDNSMNSSRSLTSAPANQAV